MFFKENVNIKNLLVSNKIFSGEENYKYLIGYFYGDYKVKPLHIIPKSSTYIKSLMNKLNGCINTSYIILFRIKSVLILKKEFDNQPVYNKFFLKTKIKSSGYEIIDFFDKEIPKGDSNHTCLTIISLDSSLKKDENY